MGYLVISCQQRLRKTGDWLNASPADIGGTESVIQKSPIYGWALIYRGRPEGGMKMDRREAIKVTMLGGAVIMLGRGQALAREYYPAAVDEKLFQGINRAENPGEEKGLEKLHSPVIRAPDTVKGGDVFPVEVDVGRLPHPMGPTHWIEHLQLNIGNEPAGNVIFRSNGYVKAAARFNVLLGNEMNGKTVSLIVQVKCNLHGIWQNYANIKIV
jgi:superoxide reductase